MALTPQLLTIEADAATAHLLLAHGAGALMTSAAMEAITAAVVACGVSVTRFEFTYMAERRSNGARRPPPRADLLTDEYRRAVDAAQAALASRRLYIGGKSMGGRVASYVADDLYARRAISGLVCVGYPAHPPLKREQTRTAHLEHIRCPTLIIQGERDPFGNREDFASYAFSPSVEVVWIADGDHDLAPKRGSGATRATNLRSAAEAIATFCGRPSA